MSPINEAQSEPQNELRISAPGVMTLAVVDYETNVLPLRGKGFKAYTVYSLLCRRTVDSLIAVILSTFREPTFC
jgi:hypothetical protein